MSSLRHLKVGDLMTSSFTDNFGNREERRYPAVVYRVDADTVYIRWTNKHGTVHNDSFWRRSGQQRFPSRANLYHHRLVPRELGEFE